MSSDGVIFGIQRFCVHDGPGIRTNVFLKGCNLHCEWCHNPESMDTRSQLSYKANRCVHCGKCENVCGQAVHEDVRGMHKVHFERCIACGKCCDVCPAEALEVIGKKITPEQLITEIKRDRLFFSESGGGLTVTGGEPMVQYDFLCEVLKRAKDERIGAAIETNGSFPWNQYEKILDDLDILLVDFKHFDSDAHKEWTGIGNERILDNLRKLSERDKTVILRCPIIPGINDTKEHFAAIADITKRYENIRYAELMPYHVMGMHKAREIESDRVREFAVPSNETVKVWKQLIHGFGGRLKEEFE